MLSQETSIARIPIERARDGPDLPVSQRHPAFQRAPQMWRSRARSGALSRMPR